MKWANSIISGGLGFTPGTKEVMRLEDKGERYGKIVTLVNMLTDPHDENAEFTFYPGIWLWMIEQTLPENVVYIQGFPLVGSKLPGTNLSRDGYEWRTIAFRNTLYVLGFLIYIG